MTMANAAPLDAAEGCRLGRTGCGLVACVVDSRDGERRADQDREDRPRHALASRRGTSERVSHARSGERAVRVGQCNIATVPTQHDSTTSTADTTTPAINPREPHPHRAPAGSAAPGATVGVRLVLAQAGCNPPPSAVVVDPQDRSSGEGSADAASGVEFSRSAIAPVPRPRGCSRQQRVRLDLVDDRSVGLAVRDEEIHVGEAVRDLRADGDVEVGRVRQLLGDDRRRRQADALKEARWCRGWCRSRPG